MWSENCIAWIQYLHTLIKEKSLPLPRIKRGPVHYCSCSYWRLPLQQWCNPITATEWIKDMPCIQIDRAKGAWCQWIALILYLSLMNICGTMAANLSRDSIKGGGKSFYGELKEDGSFYVLAIACLMWWHFMVCCLCSIFRSSDALERIHHCFSAKALDLVFSGTIPWILWV